MSDDADSKPKFGDTVFGQIVAGVVAGLVVAIMTPVVVGLIAVMTEARISLWVYFVVVIALAIIMTMVVRRWREAIWVRTFNWLLSIRFTTTRRLRRLEGTEYARGVSKAQIELQQLLSAESTERKGVESDNLELRALLDARTAALEKATSEVATLAAEKDAREAEDLFDNTLQKPPPPPLPAPAPRWSFSEKSSKADRDQNLYRVEVRNLMPRSVALAVRVDNLLSGAGRFSFADSAYWDDVSGESDGVFTGRIVSTNAAGRVVLRLSWLDENRTHNQLDFSVVKRRVTQYGDDTPF